MRKRVGITTDLQERANHWQNEYKSVKIVLNIEARGLTYDEAQAMENDYIARGYEGSPGGPRIPGRIYFVYTFSY